jgi:mannose-6-phosphate isomerase-like protein (cupin superfamily)
MSVLLHPARYTGAGEVDAVRYAAVDGAADQGCKEGAGRAGYRQVGTIVYELLRRSMQVALSAPRQLSLGARRGLLLAAATVPGYFVVAAVISSSMAPSPAPNPSDAPHTGMMLVEPEIKSTFVFRRTAADTENAYVELDLLMEAGGGPGHLASHVHPGVSEELRVLEGAVVINIEGEDHVLTAGGRAVIPKGVSHAILHVSERFALVRGRFEPASHLDTYYVQVNRAGGFSGAGSVRLAVLATRFGQHYPGWLPLWMAKAGNLLVAPSARLVGVPTNYPPQS